MIKFVTPSNTAMRCRFLYSPRHRTLERLKQRFSHRNGCPTLARTDALRLSSAYSGPSLPGIFRLPRRIAIFQSI